ncbi:hypothetical protein [Candidatus Berkiella aquae]|uniref:Uncharacterized protein n=1 Tax=Candidatus Berkiella aquae TaxID=295108 RepID=A0A0Q9YJT4_9GAMM|nr:hypothetical protein [Candidatus Berkiella aquae]MCS5710104.1 hypothetical protein [Candidatus Berkiella aquae]
MITLSQQETERVSGGMVSFGGISSTKVLILVTDDSTFTVPGLLNGQQINATFSANNVSDVNGVSLTTDLSLPFSHNGHLFQAEPINGGHIYTIYFNQG